MSKATRILQRGGRILLGVLICAFLSMAAHATTWYVDAGIGVDDASHGTSLSTPFLTINYAAQQAVAGDTVSIRGGIYRETITPKNSGASNQAITYRPYNNELVTVSGADPVNAAWSAVSGQNYYKADLSGTFSSSLNQTEQLYVDGQAMNEARYPTLKFTGPISPLYRQTASYLYLDNVKATNTAKGKAKVGIPYVDNANVYPGWKKITSTCQALTNVDFDLAGAIIWVRAGQDTTNTAWGFFFTGYVVSGGNGSATIIWYQNDPGISYGFANYNNAPFFLMLAPSQDIAALPSMMAPEHWYHDTTGNQVYLYTTTGDSPANHTIEIKRRDYAFNLDSKSFITVQGINVFAATITTDTLSGDAGNPACINVPIGRQDTPPSAPKGVAPSNHIVLDGITARYINHFTDLRGYGAQWSQTAGLVLSGSYQTFQNSVIDGADGNGLLCFGDNNTVFNNVIFSTNVNGTYAAGIALGRSAICHDLNMYNNTVLGTSFDGIQADLNYSTDPNNPSRIHHNRVSNFGIANYDVGGIKIPPYYDFKPDAFNGTRWDHNLVSDGGIGSEGLYWDYLNGPVQTQTKVIADHNICWNVSEGMNFNSEVGCAILNNTFVGYNSGMASNNVEDNVLVQNNLILTTPGSGSRAGQITTLGKSISNSTFSNNAATISTGTQTNSIVANNVAAGSSTTVFDVLSGDMRLVAGVTGAIDLGAPISSPSYLAPDGGVKGSAWDIGAVEARTNWMANVGSNLSYLQPAPTNVTAIRNADKSMTLSWTNNDPSAAAIYIERLYVPAATGRRGWVMAAQLQATATTWTDTSADAKAVNLNGDFINLGQYRIRTERSMLSNISSNPSFNGDPPMTKWKHAYFGADWNNAQIAGDFVDYNKEGLVNLLEYALGGDPTYPSQAPLPQVSIVSGKLALTFSRTPANTDITMTVQASDSLDSGMWTDLARSANGAVTLPLNGTAADDVIETGLGATRTVQVRDLYQTTDTAHPHRFMRLQVQH